MDPLNVVLLLDYISPNYNILSAVADIGEHCFDLTPNLLEQVSGSFGSSYPILL